MKQSNNIAYLYNKGEYTFFKVGHTIARFATSPYLHRYKRIKRYDRGYIVVDAEYYDTNNKSKVYTDEDYIDMQYIFNILGINSIILYNIKEIHII